MPISASRVPVFAPVYPGDTLASVTEIIGLKENSNRKNGTVYVRSTGRNQHGEPVLSFARWVMVNKREENSPAPDPVVPKLAASVEPSTLGAALPLSALQGYDFALAGSPRRWGDYNKGDKIDHVDGQTIEEAEHQLATRLFQNTARVHFNQHVEGKGRFGRWPFMAVTSSRSPARLASTGLPTPSTFSA